MTIEGYYTADELKLAKSLGAKVAILKYGRSSITFSDRAQYDLWTNKQSQLSSARGIISYRVPRKKKGI